MNILGQRRTLTITCVSILVAVSNISAQSSEPKPAPPLGAKEQAVSVLFTAFKAPRSPGCAVSITRDGATLFSHGYGLADIEQGVDITPRTAF